MPVTLQDKLHQLSPERRKKVEEKTANLIHNEIVQRRKAVAVLLVPNDDANLENILISRSPRFQSVLKQSRKSIEKGEGFSEKDFWSEVTKRNRKIKDQTPL